MKKVSSFLFFLFFCCLAHAFDDKTRVAFYYGSQRPAEEFYAFNVVVVHPDGNILPQEYNKPYSQLYAYISIGELDPNSPNEERIKGIWRKGRNTAWNSAIMDMANSEWRDFLMNQVITPLWKKGYRGFFLDTLDSYQLLKLSPEQKQQQQAGIIDLIKKIKRTYPDAQIITNRGFELLDSLHRDIVAIAAESLFAGWEPRKKLYQPVSEEDRKWLLAQLKKAKANYHLPVIVIDYLPPTRREEARKIAAQIKALGFIPWIADPQMETLGIGLVEVVPRKVLVVLGDNFGIGENTVNAFDLISFPLEYMGYVPILVAADESLPQEVLKGRYAGVIAWLDKPMIKHHAFFQKWIFQQIQQGLPVVFIQNFGFSPSETQLQSLGLKKGSDPLHPGKIAITYQDKSIMGYEIMPQPNPVSFLSLNALKGQALLKIKAESGEQQDPVAVTSWGGYALDPFYVVSFPNGESKWVINPFDFFKRALQLPEIPIPDVTTDYGRRILTIHVDGDSFISRIPWKNDEYAAELMLKEIFMHYSFPTTVSIIQREFELIQPAEAIYVRLKKVAQETFALPWINIATHTYSHPLLWNKLVEGKPNTKVLSYPDKNYLFNYDKEINGSTAFINQYLAPKDKKVSAIFWSGDGNVQEKPLKLADQIGLRNINGFAKKYTNQFKSVTNLNSYGRYVGKYLQVFSPIPNEFQYTQEWSPPYYAFEQAIHTFELTDQPDRYKPISIYYHFYSAVDQAAFRALKRVYEWASAQYTIPLQINDYIEKVWGFYRTVIAKSDDSSFLVTNNGALREMRWNQASEFPDMEKSRNVVGFNVHNKHNYIHLGPQSETWLNFTQQAPSQPYLLDANAEVIQWETTAHKKEIQFVLKGYMPLSFKLANMKRCQLTMQGKHPTFKAFLFLFLENILSLCQGSSHDTPVIISQWMTEICAWRDKQFISPSSDDIYFIKEKNHGKFEIRCAQ